MLSSISCPNSLDSSELRIVTGMERITITVTIKGPFLVVHYRIPTSNDYRTYKQCSRKLTKLIFLNSLNNFTKWI